MNSILNRHSVRSFTDQPVEKEKIQQLLTAAMQAPSAKNQQPWAFLVVETKETLEKMSLITPYAKPLSKATLGLVLLTKKDAPLPPFVSQDMGACAQNILVEAVELGLGGVWIGIVGGSEDEQATKNLFSIPSEYNVFCLMALGYPKKDRVVESRFDATRIHYESF